jgi:LmbE family N-acetylglucosaminyl deacetylase
MLKYVLLFALCISTFSKPHAQVATVTSGEIYRGLQKLNVLGSVLYIAAHPDDENTRLLTYFSKERLYRTGYLSLTRGDGGQNLIGNEQGIALGLIRTQELLAARRIDGAEQAFTRAYDFGYSKNPEETFTKWDKEKILSDVVWMIRRFQPDVIITRFPTTGEGGHGHHTASAILANEAFAAAADKSRFPGAVAVGAALAGHTHTLEHLQFREHQYHQRRSAQAGCRRLQCRVGKKLWRDCCGKPQPA